MKVELEKKDLIIMVKGASPSFEVMNHPLVSKCGRYFGGFSDTWYWSQVDLEKLTEEQLWETYQVCKKN